MSAHCGVIGGVLSRCIRSPGHAGRHEDGHYDWSGVSVAHEIEVAATCGNCPCLDYACSAATALEVETGEDCYVVSSVKPPPAWCPLRAGPLLVRLRVGAAAPVPEKVK